MEAIPMLTKCDRCNLLSNSVTSMSCNHQFCPKCLHKLLLLNHPTLLFNLTEEISLKCLQCPVGELLTTREKVNKICTEMNENNLPTKPLCPNHNQEEDVYCLDCKTLMCQECFNQHKLIPGLSYHHSVEYPYNLINMICSKHNRILQFQCVTCNVPICEVCSSLSHKDHSLFHSAQKYYHDNMKKILENFLLPFPTSEECANYIDNEEKFVKEDITKDSTSLVDQIQGLIDSLIEMKEDVLNKEKQMEKQSTVCSNLARVIFETLYQLDRRLCDEDILNYNLLFKMPAIDCFPRVIVRSGEVFKGLREIKEIINQLKNDDRNHIRLEIKRLLLKN